MSYLIILFVVFLLKDFDSTQPGRFNGRIEACFYKERPFRQPLPKVLSSSDFTAFFYYRRLDRNNGMYSSGQGRPELELLAHFYSN